MSNVLPIHSHSPSVLEFFAGIGLARVGLEQAGFRVAWSNDYEPDKWSLYAQNFPQDAVSGQHTYVVGDVGAVSGAELPRRTALAWASSPCTDLSLAGNRRGLAGSQSGAFWHFIRLLEELGDDAPGTVVLENVVGLATSNGGDDLTAAIRAFNDLGYSVDILMIDARRFVPQSRPRLFVVGAKNPPESVPGSNPELRPENLQGFFRDQTLTTHQAALPEAPAILVEGFGEVAESMPNDDPRWWDAERTERFVASLSPVQLSRITEMRASAGIKHRTAYRRTRHGQAVWEVRPDDISGCLRTARGGSSKQAVVQLGEGGLRVRWMTPREYARLMGAGDFDLSGTRDNQAFFAFGDAVAAPVVAWLSEHYLLPVVRGLRTAPRDAVAAHG
ncbi:DNA cytosine methyltransferase [Mycetocola tolaasinivorans]|uniref:DNA cytosine methyltransferase n=1 Tax=Mycetocola tolaasinivorans TaxID=76635 RepID=UPI001FE316FE|nr:DNA (cytosine-5-)-methyltransferase [Mycetocola tolaasinivorans]